MKNLRFVGRDDVRELTPTDLEQLGVEDAEATLTFRQGKSTAVEDDVAAVLLDHKLDIRETTDEELLDEERDLEAELGFPPYNPSDYTVAQVSDTLAASNEARREYILDQERTGLNRKGVFQAVGAEWVEQPAEAAEDVGTLDFVGDATKEAMAEAGGNTTSSGTSTSSTSGPANTSPDA